MSANNYVTFRAIVDDSRKPSDCHTLPIAIEPQGQTSEIVIYPLTLF